MEELSVDRLDVYAAVAQSSYMATKALIFYENDLVIDEKDRYRHEMNDVARKIHNFVTLHDIRGGEVCQGQPIARESMEEMIRQLVPSISQPMIIPTNLIMYQPGIGMAWWVPAGVRKLYFSQETKIDSGLAPVPALLFLVRDQNFYVWALEKDKRPELSDHVFHAPFFNITNGHLCTGNVKLPGMDVKDIRKWENVMFRSKFTNHGDARLKGTTMKGLWDSLIGKNKKTFPLQHLVKAGTVKNALRLDE